MNTLLKLATVTLLGACAAAPVSAEESATFEGEFRDAWLTGRIESMYLLNEHLNPFAISTEVDDGVVTLSGRVGSAIDRDLAGLLASNLDGVVDVENELIVDSGVSDAQPTQRDGDRRDFGTWVDDATTTAAVKSRLIGNQNTKGLQIDVDTSNDIVTLSGRVQSSAEKALAEQLALQAKDVSEVRNNLVVDPQ